LETKSYSSNKLKIMKRLKWNMSINRMIKPQLLHTSRTLMFGRNYPKWWIFIEKDNTYDSMANNIFGKKKSEDNKKQTTKYLTQLYSFDLKISI
jgi:hypothetical protein